MHLRKPAPATVIATIALFVAVAGTAMAAGGYVITSTKQIKPSVISSLTASSHGNEVRVLTRPVTIRAGTATPLVSAECLNGEHLVSGGYVVELAPGAYVSQNLPLGKQWLLQVNAEKSTQASTVQAVALCAAGHVSVYGVTR